MGKRPSVCTHGRDSRQASKYISGGAEQNKRQSDLWGARRLMYSGLGAQRNACWGPRIAHAQAWCGVDYGHSLFRRLLTLSPGPCPCLAPCIPPHTRRLRRSRRTHGHCSRALSHPLALPHPRTRSRTLSRAGLGRAPWPAGEMLPLQAGRAECFVRAARLSALGALSTLSSAPAASTSQASGPSPRFLPFSNATQPNPAQAFQAFLAWPTHSHACADTAGPGLVQSPRCSDALEPIAAGPCAGC